MNAKQTKEKAQYLMLLTKHQALTIDIYGFLVVYFLLR